MKKILFILFISFVAFNSQAQKTKATRWLPTKQSECRMNQIQVGSGASKSKVKINAAYSWSREKCTEQQAMNQQKVKIRKGLHYAKGSEYYFDGNKFYKISGTTCSAKGISKNDFFNLLEK